MQSFLSISRFFGRLLVPNTHNGWIWFQTLILLGGLWVGHWDPLLIVMAYFFETILIGITHIIKMLAVWRFGRAHQMAIKSDPFNDGNHFATIPFFMVHYFFFVAIQSVFIFVFFGSAIPGRVEAFHIIDNYTRLLQIPTFLMVFSLLAVTQVGRLISDWFAGNKLHQYTLQDLFFQPYLRIFVQQFVAVLAGFFFIISKQGEAAALLVIGLRFFTDMLMIGVKQDPKTKEKVLAKMHDDKTPPTADSRRQIEAFLEP